MTAGELLKKAIDADPRNLTEIAEAAGMNRTQFYKLFRGQRDPSLYTIQRVAQALGIHPAALVPPGITALQAKAMTATETGGYDAVHRLTGLIQEILDDSV